MALLNRLRQPTVLCLAGAAGTIGPWLLAAGGVDIPRRLAQCAVAVGLGLLFGSSGRSAFGIWRRESLLGTLALIALIALSTLVHFAGLSFEVGHGYYRDEGIYRAAAERINQGALLPQSFIYGHLPYYMAAWSLWFHALFLAPTTWIVRVLTGLADEASVSWMWIRLWSGLCGALTVLPVFGIGRRVVGFDEGADAAPPRDGLATAAGLLGGLLITASTLYNEVTHVYISDVPAAFFAALCLYFVARLAERESRRDYVLAGVASGLAAASKYPAGVVAIGIVAVWLWWRVEARRTEQPSGMRSGLLLAGAVSLGTFLLVMPSFLVHGRAAFAGEGRDVLFGVRQYADAGWIGVEKDSNASWYAGKTWEAFGAGALALGLAGVFVLAPGARRRWLLLAAFPVIYGLLLISMAMVVKRNLLPFLPPAAALLAAGAAALTAWIAARWPRLRWAAAAAVGVVVLAEPWAAVIAQDLSLVRAGTRQVMVDWVREHVPAGAGIVKESYTPRLDGPFDVLQTRFAARVEPSDLWSGRYDFVLLADSAYARFLDPENLRKEHQRIYAERYRRLLALPEVFGIAGGASRLGPGLSLRRLVPDPPRWQTARRFAAGDAVLLGGAALRPVDLGAGAIVFSAGDQLAVFKDFFAAGRYRVSAEIDGASVGRLRIVDADSRVVLESGEPRSATFELAAPARLFVQVGLDPPAALSTLRIDGRP